MDKAWYESQSFRALLVFVVGLVANAVGRKFGFSLNTEEIVAFAVTVAAFIAKRGWERVAETKAGAALPPVTPPATGAEAAKVAIA